MTVEHEESMCTGNQTTSQTITYFFIKYVPKMMLHGTTNLYMIAVVVIISIVIFPFLHPNVALEN